MDVSKLVRITHVNHNTFINSSHIIQKLDVKGTYSIKSAFNIAESICNNTSKICIGYRPTYNCTVYEKLALHNHWPAYIVSNDSHCMGIGQNSNTVYFEDRILGGSSSGSAMSILSGEVPYSICSDTAGSLVLPCVQNRLYGFKPSKGAISRYGLHEYCPLLDRVCIMSNCLDYLQTIYDYIQGSDPKDPYTLTYTAIDTPIDTIYDYRYQNISYKLITDYWKPVISAYAMSANNRYDGVRFNTALLHAESDDSKIIYNRNEGFTKLVKKRILAGANYICASAIPSEAPCLTHIFDVDESKNYVIIIRHDIQPSFKMIQKQEFKYGLANCLNLCSVTIPYKDHALEFMAKSGYERSLLYFIKHGSY